MNTQIKPVVVGVDDKQPTALRFALGEASRKGTGLRVVHSAEVSAESRGLGIEIVEKIREAGQNVLDDARDFINQEVASVGVEYVLVSSAPGVALEAEAHKACTVVVGTDDVSLHDRIFGGAVATRLAQHAVCPVVVVPEHLQPRPLTGGVVIALDGDSPAKGPLTFGFEQAQERGNVLHVLHAISAGTPKEDAEAIRELIGDTLGDWADFYPSVRVLLNFPADAADEACVRATDHSELVVLGRPCHHSLPFTLGRSVAAKVLRHAHCPVAVVPEGYRGD